MLGWLESADETEKNFFWTHVVDVILYRFFSIVTANIFMCANVGRVLETQPKVYQSVVCPPGVGVTSYVDAYYNFRHRFDPFAMVRPFAPVGWDPSRFITVENCEKVLQFNVHGLDHYLDDPRVHVPIIRALAGDWCITAAQEHAAIAAYDAKEEPPCIGELLAFKAKAQKISALAQTGADPIALAIAGSQFLAAAQEAFHSGRSREGREHSFSGRPRLRGADD